MEKYLIHDFGEHNKTREPVIKKFPNGVMVCLFLTGGNLEPHISNVVQIARSLDGGVTWSEPETLFSMRERGCWCPELFSDGDISFCCVNTYTGVHEKQRYRELQTYCSFTSDGMSFSEPVSFPCGLNGVSLRQGIVMTNGEWLFPMYWSEVTYDFEYCENTEKQRGTDRYPFRCGFAVSKDRGETFTRYGYLVAKESLWEPTCVEFDNGHIVCLMRYNGEAVLYKSESRDYGRTWTSAERTGIPNPNTKPLLFKIGDDVFLVNNFSDSMGKRTNLEIHRLNPDMTTQHVYSPVPVEEKWFYPHVFVDNAEKILYLAYENKREHWLQKIPFEKLLRK